MGHVESAYDLIDLMTGYQPAAVVAASCRLGVFDAIATADDTTLPGLVPATGLAPVPLGTVLEVLVALGLVRIGERGEHGLTPLSERLRTGGDLAYLVHKEAFFARVWTTLDETVRTARPRLAPWTERLVDEPLVAHDFLTALITLARETGPDLTLLPALGAGQRVLDVGGGLGSYAVPLAAAGAHVTLVDLPQVAGWARTATAGADLGAGSLAVLAADVLEVPACGVEPGSVDAVLVSHLLHDLTDAQAVAVLREALAALRPGGTLVVLELPGDGPGTFGPLFDLMMQIETPGRARSVAALVGLLGAAGATSVHEEPYPRPVLLLTGRRP